MEERSELFSEFTRQKGLSTFAADEAAANSASTERLMKDSNLLDQFARQKGLATFGDEEQEELRLPLEHHELIIHVEHCTALRPSRTGSLRGSAEKYVDHFSQIEGALSELRGEGAISVLANVNEEDSAERGAAQQPQQQRPSRPQSAGVIRSSPRPPSPLRQRWPEQLQQLQQLPNSKTSWPRIGAFEVTLTLHNTKSKARHGPCPVYSKLLTGVWPKHAKLRTRCGSILQELLKKDELDFSMEKAVREHYQADKER